MNVEPIYTEETNCQDCYKCIRECPVKAIQIANENASIMYEDCIYCAHCTQICPAEAKKPRNDVHWAEFLVGQYDHVVASIAPTYRADFPDMNKEQLIDSLYQLGFDTVSETAIGAEIVSDNMRQFVETRQKGVYISTACPVVVNLIRKYYPDLVPSLTPFLSPMQAHGKMLKEQYGPNTKVVFIGPCIAKKKEAEEIGEHVDASLTFTELNDWIQEAGIQSRSRDLKSGLYPREANLGALYPVDGGLIAGLKSNTPVTDVSYMTFSGVEQIRDVLNPLEPEKVKGLLFLELMACEGGCINGPGVASQDSVAMKRHRIIEGKNLDKTELQDKTSFSTEIYNQYVPDSKEDQGKTFGESEIKSALESVGKLTKEDELNCSGCGYESCRNFAIAMLEGKAERTMCVSYMRKLAQDKASVLLQKIPYGVVMVDDQLRVIECNSNFAELAGEETSMIYESKPGLNKANLTKLVSYHHYFSNILETGEETLEKDIKDNGRLLHLSLFTIQKHKMVCGIIHNLKVPEIQKDEIVRRTQQVIEDNLQTVQKVAFLLSENASRTEMTLNSLTNFDNEGNDEQKER